MRCQLLLLLQQLLLSSARLKRFVVLSAALVGRRCGELLPLGLGRQLSAADAVRQTVQHVTHRVTLPYAMPCHAKHHDSTTQHHTTAMRGQAHHTQQRLQRLRTAHSGSVPQHTIWIMRPSSTSRTSVSGASAITSRGTN